MRDLPRQDNTSIGVQRDDTVSTNSRVVSAHTSDSGAVANNGSRDGVHHDLHIAASLQRLVVRVHDLCIPSQPTVTSRD